MEKVSKKIKILSITPGLNLCGGIESYVMNYYRNFSGNIEMDFVTHNIKDLNYKNEIESNNNNVFVFPTIGIKTIIPFLKQLNSFFRENHNYDIIHCHMANAAVFYFYFAKKYGIKIRILHSHQNDYADTLSHKIRNVPLVKIGILYATNFMACSQQAGDFLFKNKPYQLVNNAIDLSRFKYNLKKRNEIRKKLNLNNEFLIGNVGRFCSAKNQKFLITIFSIFHQKYISSKLLIIGDGELKDTLIKLVRELKLQDSVIFLPPTNVIEDYFQAMDLFVLPSIYEGLGFVNIEAQATGLKVIASTGVPKIAKVTDNMVFLDLNSDSIDNWVNTFEQSINYKRVDQSKKIKESNYDIIAEAKKLEKKYYDILES